MVRVSRQAMEDKDCRSLAGTVGDSATSWPGEGLATAVAAASASVCASTVQVDSRSWHAGTLPVPPVPSGAADEGSHRSRESVKPRGLAPAATARTTRPALPAGGQLAGTGQRPARRS